MPGLPEDSPLCAALREMLDTLRQLETDLGSLELERLDGPDAVDQRLLRRAGAFTQPDIIQQLERIEGVLEQLGAIEPKMRIGTDAEKKCWQQIGKKIGLFTVRVAWVVTLASHDRGLASGRPSTEAKRRVVKVYENFARVFSVAGEEEPRCIDRLRRYLQRCGEDEF